MKWEMHAYKGGTHTSDLTAIMADADLSIATKAELLNIALADERKGTKADAREYHQALLLGSSDHPRTANDELGPALEQMDSLGMTASLAEGMAHLPRYSFGLHCQIVLDRPYMSRDDTPFYIIDNPVRKEKVFKVPMMAGTSWKGVLRATAVQIALQRMEGLVREVGEAAKKIDWIEGHLWPIRVQIVRLFGNEKENDSNYLNQAVARLLIPEPDPPDEELPLTDAQLQAWEAEQAERQNARNQWAGRMAQSFEAYTIAHGYRTEKVEGVQGRVHCFSTFFDQMGMEMINPRERDTGKGSNPIQFESVPAGSKGLFQVLYVPYNFPLADSDRPRITPDAATLQSQIRADLTLLTRTVVRALTVSGFGAKTSSGFGLVRDRLWEEGSLLLKTRLPLAEEVAAEESQNQRLARYLSTPNTLSDELTDEQGRLINESGYQAWVEAQGQQYTKKNKQYYDRAKKWWDREGKDYWDEAQAAKDADPEELLAELPPVATLSFALLSEVADTTQRMVDALAEQEGSV